MDKAMDWLFVSMNVLAVLVAPTAIEPNPALDGLSVTGAIAVPDSDAVFGVFEASVLIVSVSPEKAPTEGGVTVTKIVQLELAGSVPPVLGHVPDTA
jgi:hypothetical protein